MISMFTGRSYQTPGDFHDFEVIALTGLLGIHADVSDPAVQVTCNIQRGSDFIGVDISSPDILELRVYIYPANRMIYNQSFVKNGSRVGLAEQWVKNQVAVASIFAFSVLRGEAYRNDNSGIKWIGYLIWGKLGYLMGRKGQQDFDQIIRSNGRQEKDLQELISKEEGYLFWKKEGKSWKGHFKLDFGSRSRQILRDYKPSGRII